MKRSDIKNRRRTTLTLESDVNGFIEKKLRETSGLKEKELVNSLLRRGIESYIQDSSSPVSVFLPVHKSKLLISEKELKEELKKL